jgi:uncharacterized protein (TIGR02118 family)
MIKTITLLERRPDLSPAEFQQHWREVHAPLVLKLPGVLRYVQGRPVSSGHKQQSTGYDGVAEVWYESLAAMQMTLASAEYQQLLADEPNFMGRSTQEAIFLVVEEDQILEVAPASVEPQTQ